MRDGLLGAGTRGGRGRKSEGSIAGASPEDQERRGPPPEQQKLMLRQCPLAIAQQLVYNATAVSTAVAKQSQKDNVRSYATGTWSGLGLSLYSSRYL